MKTLLRIDASARVHGSSSRALADYFEARWRETNAEVRVLRRDVGREPPPHLDQKTIDAFSAPANVENAAMLSNALVDELLSATDVAISSPLYNFGLPSTLKAYFDHVVRWGRTFTQNERGFSGLAGGRRGWVITVRGGHTAAENSDDFQTPHVRAILSFIGITEIKHVALEGTRFDDDDTRSRNVELAKTKIDRWFARV